LPAHRVVRHHEFEARRIAFRHGRGEHVVGTGRVAAPKDGLGIAPAKSVCQPPQLWVQGWRQRPGALEEDDSLFRDVGQRIDVHECIERHARGGLGLRLHVRAGFGSPKT
jgi:hypothetical protein